MSYQSFRIPTHQADLDLTVSVAQGDPYEIAGSFASGDDAADKETVNGIYERLNAGDVWAWATVTVTAEYLDQDMAIAGIDQIRVDDVITGCNYRDLDDFWKSNGDYAFDMLATVLTELKERLGAVYPDSLEAYQQQVFNYFLNVRECDPPDLG